MHRNRIAIVGLGLLLVAAFGCGDDDDVQDTGHDVTDVTDLMDVPAETPTETAEDVPVETPTDVPAETPAETIEDVPADVPADVPTDVPADVPADVPEETTTDVGPAVCGDGVLGAGEVCDDGNEANEACDSTDPAACLADCSLLAADCGNGTVDPGEACDDGDTDSYDSCTTSCTVNDGSIGSPCRCTSGCNDLNMTAGTIEGCGLVTGDASSTRACMRSMNNTTYDVRTYMTEGYCSLMAMGCTGSGVICGMTPTTGNVATFACPAGTTAVTDERSVTVMGMTATITTKVCQVQCDSQADCRWNAVEPATGSPWPGACGQYACVLDPASGEHLCADPRNAG